MYINSKLLQEPHYLVQKKSCLNILCLRLIEMKMIITHQKRTLQCQMKMRTNMTPIKGQNCVVITRAKRGWDDQDSKKQFKIGLWWETKKYVLKDFDFESLVYVVVILGKSSNQNQEKNYFDFEKHMLLFCTF